MKSILVFLFYLLIVQIYAQSLNELNGIYGVYNDVEFIYQYPKSNHIKGVVFLAHGCIHTVADWWPRRTGCPSCNGLPMEMSIVNEALNRGYIPLAVENIRHACWFENDLSRSIDLIHHFYKNILKEKVPLYLLGASSGGNFIGMLAQRSDLKPAVSAMCVQISTIRIQSKTLKIPTLFIPMERDQDRYETIERIARTVETAKVLATKPRKITDTYFSDYSFGMISATESEKIYSILEENKFIDKETGFLRSDPKASNWRLVISLFCPFP
jgi:hypothetical protein